ncbi:MAG: sigma 54-interacting transcriptional regulator [Deltaproteobacteria bacterium]|nr:sigma 54-interacting transcriptional regulator [Myxococcales bacterium]MDP3216961.1 sigma 54-interacting transcriptional regulator [Deltaproteobacteria bacterium]
MPCLRWIGANGRGQLFPIYKSITTLGSAGGNDVLLPAPGVASWHAQIVFDGRDFALDESDPVAEIQINGKRKRRARLAHNDRLMIGEAELVFSLLEESDAPGQPGGADGATAEYTGLRKLFQFSERLLVTRDVQALLEALLDGAIEATGADKGFVVLLRDSKTEVRAARNLRQENLPDAVRHLSDSIIARVIESKRPLIVHDAAHDMMFKGAASVMNLRLCSVMCAPLIAGGDLLGLIYLGNDRVANLFEPRTMDVLSVFASQASLILQNALLLETLRTDNAELEKKLKSQRFGEIIGSCASMLDVYRKVSKVAPTDISVLITGETGTGKELIAREIHNRSSRATGPFIVINCGAIPENLMESELFGHVKGAFTGAVTTRIGKFQSANGGTLFLDEIGELPLNLQVKLLRALQERVVTKVGDSKPEPVNIRVLAATNRDLEEEIRKGGFREDLYYRLNVVNLFLPPLRERGDDVVVIARLLLQKNGPEMNPAVRGFTPNALIAIRKYDWPGNVRQLENRVKKALVLCDRSLLGPEDLDLHPEALQTIVPLEKAKEDFQRRYILEVLERNNGNRTKTARDLGVDPRTIFRYLEREGGPAPGGPGED